MYIRALCAIIFSDNRSRVNSSQVIVFFQRILCTQLSEPLTSLSDVASTDIWSLDTATESAE